MKGTCKMPVKDNHHASLHDAIGEAFDHYHCHRFNEAAAIYKWIFQAYPDCTVAHLYYSYILLLQGNYTEGWREHKKRPPGIVQLPQWNGEPLDGRGVLLRGEQGFGDNIQFIRYAPLIAARGGRVVVLSPGGLKRLFSTADGLSEVLEEGDQASELSCEIPVFDLPYIFSTTIDTIPSNFPYLKAEPDIVESWRTRISRDDARTVGICWQGSLDHPRDEARSVQLEAFRPLFKVPDVYFFGLQVGPGEQQAATLDPSIPFEHLGGELGKGPDRFIDAAAVIQCLDLVITVDTAIAHLAGAMGKQVWMMLPYLPDWRWMLDRDDSPWYPTIRLFRQPAPGDWDTVFQNLVKSLSALSTV